MESLRKHDEVENPSVGEIVVTANKIDCESEQLFRGYTGRISIILALGWFSILLGREAIPPLLPTISSELQLGPEIAGISLSIMWFIYSMLQYPSGRVSDQLSRTTVLVMSLSVMALGCLVFIIGTSIYGFVAAVIIIGAGSGLYFIPTRGFLSDLYVAKRGTAFGIQQSAGSLGSASASAVAIGALWIGEWRLAFVPVLLLLLWALVLLHKWSRETYQLSKVSLEPRGTIHRIIETKELRILLTVYICYAFVWQGVISFLPTLLQVEKGFSPALAGMGYSVLFIAAMLVGPIAGRFGDLIRYKIVATLSLGLSLVGLIGLVIFPSPLIIFGSICVFAMGARSFPPVMQAYLLGTFDVAKAAGDFGAVKTIYTGVGSLSPAFVGIVAGGTNYIVAFSGLALFAFVGSLLLFWISRLDKRRLHTKQPHD